MVSCQSDVTPDAHPPSASPSLCVSCVWQARAPADDIMSDVPSSDDEANTNTKGTPGAAAAAASGGSGVHDAIIVDDDDDNEEMLEQSRAVGVGVPCEEGGGNGGYEEAEEGDDDGDGDDEEHEDDTMPQHEYAYQKYTETHIHPSIRRWSWGGWRCATGTSTTLHLSPGRPWLSWRMSASRGSSSQRYTDALTLEGGREGGRGRRGTPCIR